MPKTEYFYNLPQNTLTLMTDLWSELKASQSGEAGQEQKTDYTWLYIGIGAVAVIAAGVIAYKVIQKKKARFCGCRGLSRTIAGTRRGIHNGITLRKPQAGGYHRYNENDDGGNSDSPLSGRRSKGGREFYDARQKRLL